MEPRDLVFRTVTVLSQSCMGSPGPARAGARRALQAPQGGRQAAGKEAREAGRDPTSSGHDVARPDDLDPATPARPGQAPTAPHRTVFRVVRARCTGGPGAGRQAWRSVMRQDACSWRAKYPSVRRSSSVGRTIVGVPLAACPSVRPLRRRRLFHARRGTGLDTRMTSDCVHLFVCSLLPRPTDDGRTQ